MASRPFDVVLWGCTGFTGRLVAQYFAKRVAKRMPSLRWALAGRDGAKLEELSRSLGGASPPTLLAASHDQTQMNELAGSTRVLLSTAGPFGLHGTPVVEACVRGGCDYVDINGETGWHRSMIDRYDDAARAAGVVLVPSSGFDSIPSDLGASWMAERIERESGLPTRRISCYVDLRGQFSGGTVASGIHGDMTYGAEYLADPFLLGGAPWTMGSHFDEEHADMVEAATDRLLQSPIAPFGMAPINTRIVRRTVGLLEDLEPNRHAALFAHDYCYRECLRAPDAATASKLARAAAAPASKRSELVAAGRLPSPGMGPDAATRAESWFKFLFIAEADGPAGASGNSCFKLAGTISGGDPGYDETAKMVSETAVGLLARREDSGQVVDQIGETVQRAAWRRGGFLTPATALGPLLLDRLHAEGIQFADAALPEGVTSPSPDAFC